MWELSAILEQAVANKVNDDKKFKISGSPKPDEVKKLEMFLDLVRARATNVEWEVFVQKAVTSFFESSVMDTFCGIINDDETVEMNVFHLLALYALIVDALSHYVQDRPSDDILQMLQTLHVIIHRKFTAAVLIQTWKMLK